MDIVELEKSPVVDTPHKVDVRKLYDTENAMTVHITLKLGESLKKHVTPVDVFFMFWKVWGILEIV